MKRDVGEEVYRGQELEQKQKNKENKGERNLVFTPNQPVRLYQGKEREREREINTVLVKARFSGRRVSHR